MLNKRTAMRLVSAWIADVKRYGLCRIKSLVRICYVVRRIIMRNLAIFLILATELIGAGYPELQSTPGSWLDMQPVANAQARPTLFFVFTRDCGNCHRSHNFINRLQARYGNRLNIIGIHTPEFAWEKDPQKLRAYAAKNGIRYPVYLDPEMKIWNSLNNRYWPAFFLFDKNRGHLESFIGETHDGDSNARRMEDAIVAALK